MSFPRSFDTTTRSWFKISLASLPALVAALAAFATVPTARANSLHQCHDIEVIHLTRIILVCRDPEPIVIFPRYIELGGSHVEDEIDFGCGISGESCGYNPQSFVVETSQPTYPGDGALEVQFLLSRPLDGSVARVQCRQRLKLLSGPDEVLLDSPWMGCDAQQRDEQITATLRAEGAWSLDLPDTYYGVGAAAGRSFPSGNYRACLSVEVSTSETPKPSGQDEVSYYETCVPFEVTE